jgi:hypothetical protein
VSDPFPLGSTDLAGLSRWTVLPAATPLTAAQDLDEAQVGRASLQQQKGPGKTQDP